MKLSEAMEICVELARNMNVLSETKEQREENNIAINLLEDFVVNNADKIDAWFRVIELPDNFFEYRREQ